MNSDSRFTIHDSRFTVHISRFTTHPHPGGFAEANDSRFTRTGFTLIEVLAALAITSIIIAALYSTFFISRRAVDAVDDSLIRMQECRAVVDILKREVESASYNRSIDKDRQYTIFKLDDRDIYGKQASQLLFTAFIPSRPGLSKMTYSVDEIDGRLVLKKKIEAAYGQTVETKSFELMEDIESFMVEARHGGKWAKTWDSALTGSKPDEIRVSIKIFTKKEDDSRREGVNSNAVEVSDIARPMIERQI